MMIYDKHQKEEIDMVRDVFKEYIKKNPRIDLVRSKVGYVYLCLLDYREVFQAFIINNGKMLCDLILGEVENDVLSEIRETRFDGEIKVYPTPEERAKILKAWNKYLRRLPPEYMDGLADELFPMDTNEPPEIARAKKLQDLERTWQALHFE